MVVQILINSILSALLLSLVAIGFNLIFNATKVFHLAHGAMYISAVYGAYAYDRLFRQIILPEISIVVSIILSLITVSVLIIIVVFLIYRALYRQNINPPERVFL